MPSGHCCGHRDRSLPGATGTGIIRLRFTVAQWCMFYDPAATACICITKPCKQGALSTEAIQDHARPDVEQRPSIGAQCAHPTPHHGLSVQRDME